MADPFVVAVRTSLRDWIVGAWSLHSYVEQAGGSEALLYPLGEDCAGSLIYTADGSMSVLLMRRGRPSFASGDWYGPTADEARAACDFVAYSGTFFVDEEARTIRHEIAVSFLPNLVGQTQLRVAGVEGEDLTLTVAQPILSEGRASVPRLRWTRASPR